MHFSKSDRTLHSKNYNPPCNVYQPDELINSKKALLENMYQAGQKNTFGSSARFQNIRSNVPGPDYYNQAISSQNVSGRQGKIKSEFIKKRKQRSTEACPSIPYSYYGQTGDEDQRKYIMELMLSENSAAATLYLKKKQPAFSFCKGDRQLSHISKANSQKDPMSQRKVIEGQIDLEQIMQSKTKKNFNWQQKIKKASERRLKVIQTLDPDFIPSLQLIELIKKKKKIPTPGPGQYSKNEGITLPEYQIFQNPKGITFTSEKRFSTEKLASIGPGSYSINQKTDSNKFSFGRENRSTLEKKDKSNFRFYINPGVVQNNEQKNERAQSCPFGSSSQRFSNIQPEQSLTLQQQTRNKGSSKLKLMIQAKLKIKQRRQQKDEGLLGISTMASTIE